MRLPDGWSSLTLPVCTLAGLVALLGAGCATGGASPVADAESAAPPAGPHGSAAGQAESVAASGGFSISDAVPVADEQRAAYDAAVQLIETERYEPAIVILRGITDQSGEAATPHIALGIAFARSGELEQAEASLKRAVELSPSHPLAHTELGFVLRRLGRFDEARVHYEAALSRFPDFHYAHRNLAILCDLYLGDHPCALAHYEAYSALSPEDEQVIKWIADLRNRGVVREEP